MTFNAVLLYATIVLFFMYYLKKKKERAHIYQLIRCNKFARERRRVFHLYKFRYIYTFISVYTIDEYKRCVNSQYM